MIIQVHEYLFSIFSIHLTPSFLRIPLYLIYISIRHVPNLGGSSLQLVLPHRESYAQRQQ